MKQIHAKLRRSLRNYRLQEATALLVVVVLMVSIAWPQHAHAVTAGPNGPATGTASGTGTAWGSPGNITASDSTYSAVTLASATSSNTLFASGFGFSLPATAVVQGILVEVQKNATTSTKNTIQDLSVKITQGGITTGTEHATSSTWPSTNSYVSYGGSTDTWGASWTSSLINASGFGVAMSAQNVKSGNGSASLTANVDYVRITIYYSNTPAAPTLNTPTSGATAVSLSPQFTLRTTDADNDYLRYKITIYQSDCSTVVATADQTSSQSGWSGQDQQTGTAYTGNSVITSSTMATYAYTGTLSGGTTYCWQGWATDPGGSNTWSAASPTQSFTTNNIPAAPTLSTPTSAATAVSLSPQFTLRTTDGDNDYLRYRIYVYQSNCSTVVATVDQTSSQSGWSGQDQQTGTAYTGNSVITSSTMATYTYTGSLSPGTTYCWQAQAIDPGGSNAWGSLSGTQSFTTNNAPAAPTLSSPSSGATGQATVNLPFTLKTTDADSDYLEYRIYLYQSDCSTAVATMDETSSQTGWSGQNANGGTAYVGGTILGSSALATYTYAATLSANTTYCWQAQAIDPGGSNTWSPLSGTQLFTTNSGQTMTSISGNTVIKGGTRIGN